MASALAATGKSQNGWPASARGADIGITSVAIPLSRGTKTVSIARGAAPALVEIIKWWDANVEPIDTVYGYNYREIRGYEGTGTISNHGSGTAVDINASRHPLGAQGTIPAFTAARLVAKCASLGLRWGGTYRHRKDEMHVEILSPPGVEALVRAAGGAASTAARIWWWGAVVGVVGLTGWWAWRRWGARGA